MTVKSTKNQYGSGAVIFHWLTALLILSMVPLGIFMHELPNEGIKAALYRTHIAIGMIVFIVTILRIIWKFKDNKVSEMTSMPKFQRLLARGMQQLLVIIVLLAAVSGLTYITTSGLAAQLFFAENINWPSPGDFTAAKTHGVLTILLIPLMFLHILAALYHQYFVKDAIFNRIWFKK